MIDNFHSRKESIIVTPFNTLRIVDVPISMELRNLAGLPPIPKGSTFTDELFRMVYRLEKNYWHLYGIDDSVYEEFFNTTIHKLYNMSPKTALYDICTVLENKSCDVTILTDNEKIVDDTFIVKYYDGTIDQFEQYLTSLKATGLFTEDLDLVRQIITRKNVDLKGFTFFVTEMGYNMEQIDGLNPVLKGYEELRSSDYEINVFKPYLFK